MNRGVGQEKYNGDMVPSARSVQEADHDLLELQESCELMAPLGWAIATRDQCRKMFACAIGAIVVLHGEFSAALGFVKRNGPRRRTPRVDTTRSTHFEGPWYHSSDRRQSHKDRGASSCTSGSIGIAQ